MSKFTLLRQGFAGEFFVTPDLIRRARTMRLRQFGVIHMHNYRSFQNIVVAHYAKKSGVPLVLQAHD